MREGKFRAGLVWLVAMTMVGLPGISGQAEGVSLGRVVPRGAAELNQTRLLADATVYAGDAVTTPAGGLALLLLDKGSQVHVGPASAVRLSAAEAGVRAELERGSLLARSQPGGKVSVWAANLLVSPQSPEALYQVALIDSGAIVVAERGEVSVAGANRTVTVPAGQAMRFEVEEGPQAPVGAGSGAGMTTGTAVMLSVAISLGISIPVGWIVANKLADDARQEGCQEAILSVSAALPTTGCT